MNPAGQRVLLLTPSLDFGGAEMVIVELAKALQRAHWSVCIVSMLEPKAFTLDLEEHGIGVVSLQMKPRRANARGILALLKEIYDFRPDVIHSHMFHGNILARILRPITRTPLICTIHNILESARNKDSATLRNWAYRFTDWSCDQTTTVANTVREYYVANRLARKDRIVTIPNAIDPERFRLDVAVRARVRATMGWNESFIWITVGRLELAKDYPNLLAAFGRVRVSEPNARLIVVGDGRLRAQLQRLTAESGLNSSVDFLGTRTDIPELLAASDAFVLGSAWEGAPVVLLEAATSALPIVATNVGGVEETVAPAQRQYLAPAGDSQALAASMTRLMRLDDHQRGELGIAGRLHVERHFTPSAIFRKYEALYKALIRERAA